VLAILAAFFPQANQVLEPASVKSQEWRLVRLAEMKSDGFHFVQNGAAIVRMNRVFVITCLHFVDKVSEIDSLYADFEPPVHAHKAKLVWSDKTGDLAVLATEVTRDVDDQVSIAEPRQGTEIFVVGFDDDHLSRANLNIQKGVIHLIGTWDDKNHLFHNHDITFSPAFLVSGITCRHGGSGGPAFDPDGKLVGIMKGYTSEGECLVMAVRPGLEALDKIDKMTTEEAKPNHRH
jgi:S1-C subfamily serine protease